MCYHASTPEHTKLSKLFIDYVVQPFPHYYHLSGFDHKYIPVTTMEEQKKVQGAIWGLVPGWIQDSDKAKEWADSTLNAKSETVFNLVSFKNYIKKQRCLIWIDGFYEWQWIDKAGRNKVPYYIYSQDKQPLTFGGVYSNWIRPDTGEIMITASIITTPANTLMEVIHNNKKRMPFVVAQNDRAKWLSNLNDQEIKDMMKPCTDDILEAHTISKLITQRGADTNVPEIQAPFHYDSPGSTLLF